MNKAGKNKTTPAAAAGKKETERGWSTFREIVESVAVALVIAFLFRTFIAEMFMIPTGSMAPTLAGRHKDFPCPKCGHEYQVGASVELRSYENVVQATCENCGYTVNFQDALSHGKKYPSYSGDRIVVGKYPYRLTAPQRWDVAVFLCPGNASQNYIKRVTGLPGETLKIWGGDIFISPHDPQSRDPSEKLFRIARKPAEKILATMLSVYDNDCQSEDLRKSGWPARWSSSHPVLNFGGGMQVGEAPPAEESSLKWVESADGKSFVFTPAEGETNFAQLEYRHYLPRFTDWLRVKPAPGRQAASPRLITDMVSYNTAREQDLTPKKNGNGSVEKPEVFTLPPDIGRYGLHWVGDLILECQVDVLARSPGAKFRIWLTKGGHRFSCDINLETGEAELSIPSVPDQGDVPISGMPGKMAQLIRPQWTAENAQQQQESLAVHAFLSGRSDASRLRETLAETSVGNTRDAVKDAIFGKISVVDGLRELREARVQTVSKPQFAEDLSPAAASGMTADDEKYSGVVDFPPPPRFMGIQEAIIPSEIPVRDVKTGREDTLVVDRKYEFPVYEYVAPQVGAQAAVPQAPRPTKTDATADGEAGEIADGEFYSPSGQTPMNGVSTYHVRFANVDNQLHLWVNEKLITFDKPTAYRDLRIVQPVAEDLRPVVMEACCAKMRVSHIKIFRDIYYIAAQGKGELMDFPSLSAIFYEAGLVHDQQQWEFYCNPKYWKAFQTRRSTEYRLESGQYFMMGDNSAASSDCRIWGPTKYVREDLLIGEAYYVYWPHPWNGFIPNFPNMRKIR